MRSRRRSSCWLLELTNSRPARRRADWIRLRAGYAPPHWVEGRGKTWDAGYEATAYFFDWLEERYGYGTVPEVNEMLGKCPYDDLIFKAITGRSIDKLWKLYQEHLAGGGPSPESSEPDKGTLIVQPAN